MSTLQLATITLLLGWLAASASAQNSDQSMVDDWSSHHVIFSDPGTVQDAMMNGRRAQWERIVNDPRYRMQQLRRGHPIAGQTAVPTAGLPLAQEVAAAKSNVSKETANGGRWDVPLGGPISDADGQTDPFPAKYSFNALVAPCTDYVVFPIFAAGTTGQANILGVKDLYTACEGPEGGPTVVFAYLVGPGTIQTSPVISLDGKKVAFVETSTAGSIFHILTLDPDGNIDCPSVCNGLDYSQPRRPCGLVIGGVEQTSPCTGYTNSAIDVRITLRDLHQTTRSSPYVDYDSDIAYVGDDDGVLHKIIGVFRGAAPTEEVTTNWPATVSGGSKISSPVVDPTTGNIFVGGNNGNIYCKTSTGVACTPNGQISVGSTTLTAPVLDVSRRWLYAAAPEVVQVNMNLATSSLREVSNVDGTRWVGALNDAYYDITPVSGRTPYMYFCGDDDNLYRVGFDQTSTPPMQMNLTTTGTLAIKNKGECQAIIDAANPNNNTERLLFVTEAGNLTPCMGNGSDSCIYSILLPATGAMPTAANVTRFRLLGPFFDDDHMPSNLVLDTVVPNASNIYFGTNTTTRPTGTQLTQAGLD